MHDTSILTLMTPMTHDLVLGLLQLFTTVNAQAAATDRAFDSKTHKTWIRDRKELGHGGFGVVWRETCVETNAVRAVKVIFKQDPRLSPKKLWEREIQNFIILKKVCFFFS
jgi:hypothetical protein